MTRVRKRQKVVKKPIGFMDRVLTRIEEDPEKFLSTAAQAVSLGTSAAAAVRANPSEAVRTIRNVVVSGLANGLRRP